jgi:ribonuclease VapC
LSEYVLDASALIALVNGEKGAEKVRPLLPQAVIGAVNLCETVQVLRRGGLPMEAVIATLKPLLSTSIPLDESLAYRAASIHEHTRDVGLSFGDCACLALADQRKAPAVTAERAWDEAAVGVKLVKIR